MAIVLPYERPALDIADGTFTAPDPPWEHLDRPEIRARLERAIGAVGRVDYVGHATIPYGGTAFAVGPDLLLTSSLDGVTERHGDTVTFAEGRSAVVDFGQETGLGDSLRVEIEEVLYVDPRWRIELVRATLPDLIAPLQLSVTPAQDLAGGEAVLLAYPAWDGRNDREAMDRIFHGRTDVKRLLPGRLLGREERAYFGQDLGVLAHDCTSTGGCGGGPLVDTATGDVVGIHFAGFYLQVNHAVPAFELARDPRFADAGVQFAGTLPAPIAAAPTPREGAGFEERSERVTVAPDAEVSWDTSPGDEPEPIPASRPSWRAADWRAEIDDAWSRQLSGHLDELGRSMRAVGRLRHGEGPTDWTGTAFLVGERLALTASFNVDTFADGAGPHVRIRSGMHPAVDFQDSLQLPSADAVVPVTGVRFIHPYFQVALLELESMPEGAVPLDMASQAPAQLSGRLVALVAFAMQEAGPCLLLHPGKALQLGQLPGELAVPVLVHDCADDSGSAGAPVLDLATGGVLGVHTHAQDSSRSLAQPSWELARDPNVWDSEIRFRPDPRPPWLGAWRVPGALPPERQEPGVESDGDHWTVDEVPIDWTRTEPQEIEEILIKTVPYKIALIHAQNVGVPVDYLETTGAPRVLWRGLLVTASTAAQLRRLLDAIAGDPDFAGVTPLLKPYI